MELFHFFGFSVGVALEVVAVILAAVLVIVAEVEVTVVGDDDEVEDGGDVGAVSYTHLTLPTILRV